MLLQLGGVHITAFRFLWAAVGIHIFSCQPEVKGNRDPAVFMADNVLLGKFLQTQNVTSMACENMRQKTRLGLMLSAIALCT